MTMAAYPDGKDSSLLLLLEITFLFFLLVYRLGTFFFSSTCSTLFFVAQTWGRTAGTRRSSP